MKKNELRSALGKIQPREELILSTIAKVREQKRKEEKTIFSPLFARGVKLAGALCAFVLVFCIGFAAARQGIVNKETNSQVGKSLLELETDEKITGGITSFDLEEETKNGWIMISGRVDSLNFLEPSVEEKENGVIRACNVKISATGLLDRSDDLNVDLEKISADLEAAAVFYDHALLESFLDMSYTDMLFRLTPNENDGWIILDFAALEQ